MVAMNNSTEPVVVLKVSEVPDYPETSKSLMHIQEREDPPPINFHASKVLVRRFGKTTILTLLFSGILETIIVAWLAFIWCAHPENTRWHTIMVRGWVTRAVSIPTLLLRAAIDLQSGLIAAMLAALALESGRVLLRDAAMMSTARADRIPPRRLLLPTIMGTTTQDLLKSVNLGAVVLLCLTTLVLQLSSTFLLSDLHLGLLPGLNYTSILAYDFEYHPQTYYGILPGGWSQWFTAHYPIQARMSTWQRNPSAFPTFAEYSEPPPPSRTDVDDTGVLLRAFLPYVDTQSRENIRNHTGHALVLDSRVSRQRPHLESLSVGYTWRKSMPTVHGPRYAAEVATSLVGILSPFVEAERLWTGSHPVPFNCSYLVGFDNLALCEVCQWFSPSVETQWVGEANRGPGLISQFANNTDPADFKLWAHNPNATFTWGTALLVLNASSRYFDRAPSMHGGNDPVYPDAPAGKFAHYDMSRDHTLRMEERDVWVDILSQKSFVNLSVSVWFAAWDTARLGINAYRDSPHHEPIPHWSAGEGYHTIPDVNSQLGNNRVNSQDPISRGVLKLAWQESFVPNPQDAVPITIVPQVQALSNIGSSDPKMGLSMGSNMSVAWTSHPNPNWDMASETISLSTELTWGNLAVLSAIHPDPALKNLFATFWKESGSLARTVSSLITVLSSMAYYDQMPQYLRTTNATQVFFETVLFPQSYHGFSILVSVLLLHLLVVISTTVCVALRSQHTVLGNHWQSVAQLLSPDTQSILSDSTMATDREVRAYLHAARADNVAAVVVPIKINGRVGVVTSDAGLEGPEHPRSVLSKTVTLLSS